MLGRLEAGENLSSADSAAMIGGIMDGTISATQAAALLRALAIKGETVSELLGAARAMRDRSLMVKHDLPLVADVVGSGGDNAGTINISTVTALVVASAGVPVAKHGNRAATSKCGSADLLEAGGMAIEGGPESAARSLRETGFAFMFAPVYHPAMKTVAPIRRELGMRTIFNSLGPLTNPARATHQLVGVATEELVEPVAEVMRAVGIRGGAVVHASSGIDEVGGEGPTSVYEFGDGWSKQWTLDPDDFGVRASLEQIRGGSVERCLDAFTCILAGERSPRADVIALNAALALVICGRTADIKEGMMLARAQLEDGHAAELFERVKRYSHA